MKNPIIILGITIVSLANVCHSSNISNHQMNFNQTEVFKDNTEEGVTDTNSIVVKPSFDEDYQVFNPETVIGYTSKTLQEIIIEDEKIIEDSTSDDLDFKAYEDSMTDVIVQSDLIVENKNSDDVFLPYFENSIEDTIKQLEATIESQILNETNPLDFKVINKKGF